MKNKLILTSMLFIGATILVFAQAPSVTVDSSRHGNLARAQQSIHDAWTSIDVAQRDNGNHLGGHAVKAKELLDQANQEIQNAANSADAR